MDYLILYGSLLVSIVVARAPWMSNNGLLTTSLMFSGSMLAFFVYAGAPWFYNSTLSLALAANHGIFYYQFKNATSNIAQELKNPTSKVVPELKNPSSNNARANSSIYLSLIILNIITVLAGCILGWMGLFSIFIQLVLPGGTGTSLGELFMQMLFVFEMAEGVILFILSIRSWRYMRQARTAGSLHV